MKADVLVIGSGLGGLAVGTILSRAGRRVVVLEQGAVVGGCLQSFRRGAETLDTGLHYVGGLAPGQSLHRAFRHLGLLSLPWQRLDADGFDRVSIGSRTYSLHEGYDAYAEALAEAFPEERAALAEYVGLLRRAAETQSANLAATGGEDFASMPPDMEESAWEYLTTHFRSAELINVLSGTCLKMELRRESLPLFTFLHGNGSFIESSWRLRGSGQLIADRLVEQIEAAGGSVVCRRRVTALEEADGRILRARCEDGSTFEADVFVSDIHPAQTLELVPDCARLRRNYRRRMDRLEPTFGMFTAQLRLPAGRLRYFNYNHYVYRQANVWDFYEHQTAERIDGVLVSARVPEDDTEWATQIDLLTPAPWSFCERWAETRRGRRGADYDALKRRAARSCIELAATQIPELSEAEIVATSSPLTWRDYTLTPCGAAYGTRKDYRTALTTMLSPRTPLDNLLLTGQNVLLHGIHGVTLTAFNTAAEILGRDAIDQILNGEA